jgi:cobalt/nickel transport protein
VKTKDNYWIIGLVFALLLAGVISLFASSDPDGLEKVAEDFGFMSHAEGKEVMESPLPDYVVPGLGGSPLAASLAGVLGTLMVFGFALLLGKAFRRQNS